MPASRTSFLGRDSELQQVGAWLEDGVPVTIVGAAGVGKSRLALEVVQRWHGDVYEVGMHLALDSDGCVARVSRALDLPPHADAAGCGRALAARDDALLVLDDVDTVVAPIATLLAQWMQEAPGLRLIATSRERLRMRSERTLELGPLEAGSAAQLFRERVFQVAPQAELDDALVGEWCQWLEGIPLAIELAAARAPLIGQAEGRRRLDVLRGGFRDGHSRHETLARAIEWSWSLLDDAEKLTLTEAAAFTGAFHVGATGRVLTSPSDSRATLDIVRSLADKSFMRVLPDGRLRLFDAVREFASAALPGQHAAAVHRLDSYLASQAQRAGAGADALPTDVMAAAERVVAGTSQLSPNACAWVLILASESLTRTGPASRLEHHMRAGLERLADAHVDLRTRLRIALASALRMQGKYEDANAIAAEARTLEAELLDEVKTMLWTEVALVKHAQRDLDGAAELYASALEVAPSRRAEGRLHANLGAISHDRGDLDAAEATYRRALVALSATGDPRLIGVVRSNLALVFQERGALELAKVTLETALEELLAVDERYLSAIHQSNLGMLHLERGEAERAIALHCEAIGHLQRIGDQRSMVLCLCRRAAAAAWLGRAHEANVDLERAEVFSVDVDDPLLACVLPLHQAFVPLARALSTRGDARIAAIAECRTRIAQAESASADWRLSDDARAARRMLETELGPLSAVPVELREDALVVGIESRFFRVPGGSWQDLRSQTAARRILEHLVQTTSGGTSILQLLAVAWPGEIVRKDAATNRVHVALSKLRQRGLKPHIVRDEQGYLLDASVPIQRLPSATPPEG